MADPNAEVLTPKEIRDLVASNDPAVRKAIADRQDVRPEILYYLANDDVSEIRISVALNPQSPPQIFMLLANDKSTNVRTGLASRFLNLAPNLNEESLSCLWKVTHKALRVLARDQVVRVRQAMAEALKGYVSAPHDIINVLAHDLETIVSAPVLEMSPVLSNEDLLEIISQGTAGDNLMAISRRSTVSPSLSDAIVKTDNAEAIAELLYNQSAQIREETLDVLIDRAPEFKFWHSPLVSRPVLPSGAPQRLALFIADSLIEKLKDRNDIDSQVLAEITDIMQERFGDNKSEPDRIFVGANLFDFLQAPLPMFRANRLVAQGVLDEGEIMQSLQAGDFPSVLAALVALTGIDGAVVKRIFKEQNAKAIVALVWRAGLSPELMIDLQRQVARLSPNHVIKPLIGQGQPHHDTVSPGLEFPISHKEMDWNIQFFITLVDRDAET